MSDRYQGPEYRTVHEIRAADNGTDATTITFARFDVWNEIYDWWEGRFLERLTPGAFADTFRERADHIKVLFNHGRDPSIGNKALGLPENLREDDVGPTGDVHWLNAPYVDDIRAGMPPAVPRSAYGASYRFGVEAEEWDRDPGKSDHNPDGIPERTIHRVAVAEFGPVTFPADEGTTGLMGVRSLTERFTDHHPPPSTALLSQNPNGLVVPAHLAQPPQDRDSRTDPQAEGAPGSDPEQRARTATAYTLAKRRRAQRQR